MSLCTLTFRLIQCLKHEEKPINLWRWETLQHAVHWVVKIEKFYNSSPLCSEGKIYRKPEESNFLCFVFRGTVLNLFIPWGKNYKKRNDSVNFTRISMWVGQSALEMPPWSFHRHRELVMSPLRVSCQAH